MRKLIASLAVVASLGAAAAPAAGGPTVGGFASDNIEHVSWMPLHADAVGGAHVGKYFYLTTERDLTIYDVTTPEAPKQVGHHIFSAPGEFYLPEEDPETNGRILLVGNGGSLIVIDVEDKTNPKEIATLAGADEHTISCVLDCKWAYGSEGVIVDLRDPAKPKIAGDWGKLTKVGQTHDVTEVSPGIVVTSSNPMMVLDARKNPAKPKVIAVAKAGADRFFHSNLWPNNATDRYLLVGGETSGPSCEDKESATFSTWDMSRYKETGTFTEVHRYEVTNGLPTDGNAPADLFCTHWFDTRPGYRNGGLVSLAWYEHGTRLLEVDSKGKIKEIGWFVPFVGSTSATYWINDKILYAADYNRGLDILRYTGK